MLGLLAAGADPVGLLIWGTIGNLLGGMFNYWIGTKGKEEWIEKYAKVKPQDLHKGLRYVRKYGAWAGLLAWQHTHGLDGLSSHQPLLFRVHDCLGKIHPLRSDRQLLRLILATRPGKLQIQCAPNGGR